MCNFVYSDKFSCKIMHIQHIVEVPIVKVDPTNPFGWDLRVITHEDRWTTILMYG